MQNLSPKLSPAGRPRSNSYSSSSIKDFHVGTKVLIIETENVAQRAPHLIGKVGLIAEVPVHPATWFKVEFPEMNLITTFRPSALRVIPSDADSLDQMLDLATNESSLHHSMIRSSPQIKLSNLRRKIQAKNQYSPGNPYINYTEREFDIHPLPSNPNQFLSQSSKNGESLFGLDSSTTSISNQMSSPTSGLTTGSGTSAGVTPVKDQIITLDVIDPEKWVGSSVRVIGGKRHNHEGKIVRSGNGWVQVINHHGEEYPHRAHELQVLEIPGGMSLDQMIIHTNPNRRHRGGYIHDSVHNSNGTTGSNHPTDTEDHRYTSLYQRRERSSIPTRRYHDQYHSHHHSDELSSDHYDSLSPTNHYDRTKDHDYYHWTKEIKQSISIDQTYSCPLSIRKRSFVDPICPTCFCEKLHGAKFCWNNECPSSPLYSDINHELTDPKTITMPPSPSLFSRVDGLTTLVKRKFESRYPEIVSIQSEKRIHLDDQISMNDRFTLKNMKEYVDSNCNVTSQNESIKDGSLVEGKLHTSNSMNRLNCGSSNSLSDESQLLLSISNEAIHM